MHRRCALLAVVLVAACGGEGVRTPVAATRLTAGSRAAPPATKPGARLTAESAAEPQPAKPDGRLVAVSARALPERFVVDGELSEWGAPALAAKAASRVVVGIGSTRVGIAAELRAAARDGIWLKVRFPVSELSALQEDAHRDTPGRLPRCEREHAKNTAAIEACRAELLARQERFQAELFARFVHVYRVDASGVRLVVGGQLVPIPGASFAKRADADGLSLEAELPLTALPRSAEAPIKNVSAAAAIDGDPASFAGAADVASVLAPPVGFEPNADVRAAVFGDSESGSSCFHYQPGDPSSLGVSGFPVDAVSRIQDESRYTEATQRLFVPLRTFSDFTIVKLYPDKLGTMRDGKLISSGQGAEQLRGFVERNGELHAFFLWRGVVVVEARRPCWASLRWSMRPCPPMSREVTATGRILFRRIAENGPYEMPSAYWEVLAIQRDGTVTRVDLSHEAIPFERLPRETHAPDFSTFSVAGEVDSLFYPGAHGAPTVERVVWRWDDKEKTYRDSSTP